MKPRTTHKNRCMLPLLAVLALAASAENAPADGPTVILGYICATYESARSVALSQGWRRPETMPGDCRALVGLGLEQRIGTVFDIIEVLPLGDGRWVEIGAVRGNALGKGYSAGMPARLLVS